NMRVPVATVPNVHEGTTPPLQVFVGEHAMGRSPLGLDRGPFTAGPAPGRAIAVRGPPGLKGPATRRAWDRRPGLFGAARHRASSATRRVASGSGGARPASWPPAPAAGPARAPSDTGPNPPFGPAGGVGSPDGSGGIATR